jgi:glucose/arabinose dehydrogenase
MEQWLIIGLLLLFLLYLISEELGFTPPEIAPARTHEGDSPMNTLRPVAISLAVALAFAATSGHARDLETERATVRVTEVAQGLEHPWGFEFLPDARIIVTERAGRVRLVATDGTVSPPLVRKQARRNDTRCAGRHSLRETVRVVLRPKPLTCTRRLSRSGSTSRRSPTSTRSSA